MPGLRFETVQPVPPPDPNRVDIACFVGFVGRRQTRLPETLRQWFQNQGWVGTEYARPTAAQDSGVAVATLEDVPVPVDSWAVFDQLFAWEARSLSGSAGGESGDEGRSDTYLGAAVRSFFAQGGQRCYVVRMGDPWPVTAARETRLAALERLIPGYVQRRVSSHPLDAASWHGIGHLLGLPEVSFLSLPDLPDAVSRDRPLPPVTIQVPAFPEQFVECSEPAPEPPPDRPVRLVQSPRCEPAGYGDWANALNIVARFLQQWRREVQLVSAIPLPEPGTPAEQQLLPFLLEGRFQRGDDEFPLTALADSLDISMGLSSAFVQLVYPWLRSPGSLNLPQQLENPEGVLIGILSRNALQRGTFRSAASAVLGDVYDLFPVISSIEAEAGISSPTLTRPQRLLDRISLLGPTPAGLRLLSDVTTSQDLDYRPASINRLVASLLRAARRLGEELVFESSGELLWSRIREALNSLLLNLYRAGALSGITPEAAFQVRCDRTTMTQQDLDLGRAIALIHFTPALPIEQITVQLILTNSSQLIQFTPAVVTQPTA
jgi:uncharacterized protein